MNADLLSLDSASCPRPSGRQVLGTLFLTIHIIMLSIESLIYHYFDTFEHNMTRRTCSQRNEKKNSIPLKRQDCFK